MNKSGFFRVGAAVPVVTVADTRINTQRICALIESAVNRQVSLLVFPRLCITGSACGSLFSQQVIHQEAWAALEQIAEFCTGMPITVIVSAPVAKSGIADVCNIVISSGEIQSVLREEEDGLFNLDGVLVSAGPGSNAHIVLLPSSDCEDIFSHSRLKHDLCAASSMDGCAYVYCNSGFGESTTDGVHSGYCAIFENGRILSEGTRFSMEDQLIVADIDINSIENAKAAKQFEPDGGCDTDLDKTLYMEVDPYPFIPDNDGLKEAFDIQATGLATRLKYINGKKVVIGISGGLDSTLALLCAINAFERLGLDKKGVIGITLPGFGTSGRTHGNAWELMAELGISRREIDITEACRLHLKTIGHDGVTQDTAYENAQARERTQILMDVANMENALVIGTGDLSELALGWCTYNGDHMSNYAVNASIPKTLARAMVEYAADNVYKGTRTGAILHDIVATPVSPELKGKGGEIEQKTEDLIGPYDLHDFFIWYFVHKGCSPEKTASLAEKAFSGTYSPQEINKWLELFIDRFFKSQFKRSCAPDGVKVTPVSFSPREGWTMPSDASANLFKDNIR